jgi:signal transduction histidine kinase
MVTAPPQPIRYRAKLKFVHGLLPNILACLAAAVPGLTGTAAAANGLNGTGTMESLGFAVLLLTCTGGLLCLLGAAVLTGVAKGARRRRTCTATAHRFAEDVRTFADVAHLAQRLVAAASELLDSRAVLWVADGSDPAPVPVDVLQCAGEQVLVLERLRASRQHPEVAAALEQAGLDACVLLPGRWRLMGVLTLGGGHGSAGLTQDQVETLRVIATQAAIAIENIHLHDQLGRSLGLVERASGLASLGLLTSGFAHEVRGMLVPIRTFAQLLPERWDDAGFRREFGAMMLSEVARMSALINDFLRATRAQQEPSKPASLTEVMGSVMPLLVAQAKVKGVEVELSGDKMTPFVAADAAKVRHAAMSVVLSAIEETPCGGRVRIIVGQSEATGTTRAFLRVAESESGIAPEHREGIFDPFCQRNERTALGLSVAREIVREYGGTFDVDSAPGCGTSFTIELPVSLWSEHASDAASV